MTIAQPAYRPHRLKVAIPIRVRGMSVTSKFFDETTETLRVGDNFVITRLQSRVDLEAEVYVANTKNEVGGTFRVVWVNTQGQEGWHDVGLELIQSEGRLWGIHFPAGEESQHLAAQAQLECQRCHRVLQVPLPEAEEEFLYDGFLIARACETCKATTPWTYVPETEREQPAETEEALEKTGREKRRKGRAPINFQVLITRKKYDARIQDVCKTVNVSGEGVCFLSNQTYAIGEEVKVVMPYKEGDPGIPVRARVVRQEDVPEGSYHSVAVQFEPRRE